jgi:hypothetical protein
MAVLKHQEWQKQGVFTDNATLTKADRKEGMV